VFDDVDVVLELDSTVYDVEDVDRVDEVVVDSVEVEDSGGGVPPPQATTQSSPTVNRDTN
jgi:hypothetical protein